MKWVTGVGAVLRFYNLAPCLVHSAVRPASFLPCPVPLPTSSSPQRNCKPEETSLPSPCSCRKGHNHKKRNENRERGLWVKKGGKKHAYLLVVIHVRDLRAVPLLKGLCGLHRPVDVVNTVCFVVVSGKFETL